MNRRNFIKAGILAGISPTLLHAVDPKSTKKCVFVYLGGGISHIELINPIPESPVEFRSVMGAVGTKSGYQLGGGLPLLANCSELFTTVRNFGHRDANHNSAAHWVNTGRMAFNIGDSGTAIEPSYGSLVCHQYGPNAENGMPHYVKVNSIPHDDGAWLGSKYMGYDNDAEATKNLKLNIGPREFQRRTEMLDLVNRNSVKRGNTQQIYKEWEDIRKLAIDVVSGDVSKSFDLSLEPEHARQLYSSETSGFGKSLLSARRLLESGCKFVTAANNGWDMHSDIKEGFSNRIGEFDKGMSVFLKDLKDRGLLEDTLVVITSEFGRTPRKNQNAGRDHWSGCTALLMAGAGYGGTLIGKTDDKASIPDNPFHPEDLCWTIMNHFGVEKSLTIVDSLKRPRHIIEKEAKLIG